MALPERIGRYRILGLLGRGAMGVVYRARDAGLERDVALKVMAAADRGDEGRERFLREARAAARLQHPNIVVLYELGEHEGAPFMAMELLDGLDLQRALASGLRPDPKVTLPIVLQLLAGLGHAHEHGIVHRDVKPSNVFLPRGRPAKVMDFGVARLAAGTTAAGAMVGTPNYMSPEQARGGALDGRSDLFSAGLILHELVTGEKVFRADNVVSLLYKIAHEEPALGGLPQGPRWQRLRGVVARALARSPDERYPDARSMADELSLALSDLGGAASGPPAWDALLVRRPTVSDPPPPARPPAAPVTAEAAPTAGDPQPEDTSRRLAMAVLGVATAALVTGIVLFVTMRPEAPAPEAAATPAASPPAVAAGPAAAPSAIAVPPTPTAPTVAPEPATTPAVASPRSASPRAAPPPPVDDRPAPNPAADTARLEKANDLFERGRYAAALSEARAVLRRNPGNAEARTLVEDAEVAIVVEDRIKKARDALRRGDRERALQEARAGLAVAPSDGRLLALFKEATQ